MAFGNNDRRIVLTALLCAGLSCVDARLRADFEIESFTRYRLIRMDNNNNGYVDDFEITEEPTLVERTAIAEMMGSAATIPNSVPAQSSVNQLNATAAIDTATIGFGAIHLNFRTPTDFLGGLFDNSVKVVVGADGFVDEIVRRPEPSTAVASTSDSIGWAVDFDDLHQFNVAFESLKGLSYAQGRGVQLEKVIRFRPSLSKDQTSPEEPYTTWEVYYGVRFYQFDDSFTFEGNGGILGHTWAATSVENQHGGPHFGGLWNFKLGGWTLALSGLVQCGLGTTDSRQAGRIGEDLNPGSLNSPIYALPHVVGDQLEDQFDTIYSEVRGQVKRQLSKLATLTVGCSAYYFGDIKFADHSVNWFIPDLGVLDGTEDRTVTTAFVSLEFRR